MTDVKTSESNTERFHRITEEQVIKVVFSENINFRSISDNKMFSLWKVVMCEYINGNKSPTARIEHTRYFMSRSRKALLDRYSVGFATYKDFPRLVRSVLEQAGSTEIDATKVA